MTNISRQVLKKWPVLMNVTMRLWMTFFVLRDPKIYGSNISRPRRYLIEIYPDVHIFFMCAEYILKLKSYVGFSQSPWNYTRKYWIAPLLAYDLLESVFRNYFCKMIIKDHGSIIIKITNRLSFSLYCGYFSDKVKYSWSKAIFQDYIKLEES